MVRPMTTSIETADDMFDLVDDDAAWFTLRFQTSIDAPRDEIPFDRWSAEWHGCAHEGGRMLDPEAALWFTEPDAGGYVLVAGPVVDAPCCAEWIASTRPCG